MSNCFTSRAASSSSLYTSPLAGGRNIYRWGRLSAMKFALYSTADYFLSACLLVLLIYRYLDAYFFGLSLFYLLTSQLHLILSVLSKFLVIIVAPFMLISSKYAALQSVFVKATN
jgi:hypothetical protein